ncbi:MAG: DUF4174 domain-containing protein [Verrucomicrobia bacterium]|nr:DUF4174 domain-containing protein [Verrucomicrobiota bacterium]
MANPLKTFQWENRLILVRTTPANQSELIRLLADEAPAIDERHIVWFVFDGNDSTETNHTKPLPNDFSKRINEAGYWESGHSVLLIGKDGGIKARQKALDLELLFRRIDAMPMRRAEMRE